MKRISVFFKEADIKDVKRIAEKINKSKISALKWTASDVIRVSVKSGMDELKRTWGIK